jgi:lipopolysaccharide/colanic/teichoic acid biosynthesis glycosyltransferase
LEYDLFYLQGMSVLFDIRILLRTVRTKVCCLTPNVNY